MMRFMLLNSDEGIFLSGAERIVNGQVFARDFFEGMGPGSFYWLAAFFKLFGDSFASARICLFVSLFGTGVSMYFLARRLSPRFSATACLVLMAALFPFWPSHHVDSNFAALLSVVSMVLGSQNHKRIYFITAGVLAGLTTCILQPKGVLLLCALLGWTWLQRGRFPGFRPSALIAAGYSAAIFFTLLFFWSRHALRSLVYANLIFPFKQYGAINHVNYGMGITNSWREFVSIGDHSHLSVALASVLIMPYVFVAALPLLSVILGLTYLRKPLAPEVSLYAVAGVAIWLGEYQRRDIPHLVSGSPLLLILCIYLLAEARNRVVRIMARTIEFSALCLALFNLLIVTVVAHPFQTRVGVINTLSPTANVSFLMSHVPAGEEIFVYPYKSDYYFVSGTKNPTHYSFLLYNNNLKSQFQDVIATLERRKIKYVVWDTTFITGIGSTAFPGMRPTNPSQYIFEPYLQCHYRAVQKDHGEWVMVRKSDSEIFANQCSAMPM